MADDNGKWIFEWAKGPALAVALGGVLLTTGYNMSRLDQLEKAFANTSSTVDEINLRLTTIEALTRGISDRQDRIADAIKGMRDDMIKNNK